MKRNSSEFTTFLHKSLMACLWFLLYLLCILHPTKRRVDKLKKSFPESRVEIAVGLEELEFYDR